MRFEKAPTVAYLCLMPMLIALGMWQLGRSEEKKLFLEQQQQGLLAAGTLTLTAAIDKDVDGLKYKKVQGVGRYDMAHQFLLDNQINGGKPGYFILTPFVLEGGAKAVLVNRGWLPAYPDRSVLPGITINRQQTAITGRINSFPSVGIKLAGAQIPTEGWPSVIQVVDAGILANKLAYPVFSFQVELDKDQAEGYKREWQTTKIMQPEQHTAYAVQWFALAFTLTILFIGYCFKKNDQ
ncbi:MAG: SURF1 family protein [Methylococcales bacterium]|nr:SURF1 family protein [Methylococcales bacterium]